MNGAGFDKALGLLLDGFQERGIRAAAIGGFAMALADAQGGRLDWERLEEYFDLFKRGKEFAALKARYPDA